MSGAVILLTGWQAAGKSTLAPMLAARFPLSAHVEGDVFFKMPVSGRADMSRDPTEEALRQLRLRYRAGVAVADLYAGAGFTAVHTDIIMGSDLAGYPAMVAVRPLYIVVLHPSPAALTAREMERGATRPQDHHSIDADSRHYHAQLDASPRLGLWLDTSGQTPDDTVEEIRARLDEARIT